MVLKSYRFSLGHLKSSIVSVHISNLVSANFSMSTHTGYITLYLV